GPKRNTLPDTGACERGTSGRPFRVDQFPPGCDRIEPMAATVGLSDLSSLHPMPLVRIPELFEHEQFVFELKHDGFRALAVIRGHHCELVSRRGHVYKFPQLVEELAHAVRADDAILDGEIVCLDARGRSRFYSLLFRREWPYFMAFDALHIDGEDLMTPGWGLGLGKKRLAGEWGGHV